MAVVEKKCWPDFFEKIATGEKSAEIRLADFKINEGDTMLLKEFDPTTKKFSGREIKKKCKAITKFDPFATYKESDLKKYGCYLIELE
jgi:ASC-1-like (ASCH) protein